MFYGLGWLGCEAPELSRLQLGLVVLFLIQIKAVDLSQQRWTVPVVRCG